MELDASPAEQAFRGQLLAFLSTHPCPAGTSFEDGLDWQRTLNSEGWVAPHWPTEYGGRDCTLSEYAIYIEEMGRHRGPQLAGRVGVNMIGPTLLEHGTPAQRSIYLPNVLSGTQIWCELFSEPDNGSDLRSVTTRARVDGDGWVVSGQKVWSSFADRADLGLLLARTGEPNGDRPPELTCFICDMHSPGVEVRPLRQLTGDSEFAEVFLDDVRLAAGSVVGRVGGGWSAITTTLSNERGLAYPLQEQIRLERSLEQLLGEVRRGERSITATERLRLAQTYAQGQLFKLLNLRALSYTQAGINRAGFSSVTKLWWSAYAQALQETKIDIISMRGAGGHEASWREVLWYRQSSIAGGTSEIQLNVIAERALGLPREFRPRG
jgi:alkylation response protein AidB-like acyl-CoA dehydrogenase